MNLKAISLAFRGRVQGVGFRSMVREICSRQGVGGWVRNEESGDVLSELHGHEDAVNRAIVEIRYRRARDIRECVESNVPFDSELANRRFEIRR